MVEDKTRLEFTHLNIEEKTPLSPTSDWILNSLAEEEDLAEMYFR
jgi:hypothetical protein